MATQIALAFDVYGTLIDTAGVTARLETLIGDKARVFSDLWRMKQLEYTWRYGLMDEYHNFRVCTSQALEYCCRHLNAEIAEVDRQSLMQNYLTLPVFDDVVPALQAMKDRETDMFAFSNGVPSDLSDLLDHAGISEYFDGIVSVDEVSTFKPSPLTYRRFSERAGRPLSSCWLVSSNSFDVCGARATGMHAIWVQRNPGVTFDSMPHQPDAIVHNFSQLAEFVFGF
ncbi:MAG: haloacid dehalogenase type II [Pseudomonadota bacterium]